MDLVQRQVGMMPLDLFGIPAVDPAIQCEYPHLDAGPRDDRLSRGIVLDVGVGHRSHDDPPASEEELPLLRSNRRPAEIARGTDPILGCDDPCRQPPVSAALASRQGRVSSATHAASSSVKAGAGTGPA